VSFTPGAAPWQRLARSLVEWLEPDLSPVELATRASKLGGQLERGEVGSPDLVDEGLRRSGADRLLLVVDQFEELFTEASVEHRRPFARALVELVRRCAVTPVLTLRADFYGFAIDLNPDLTALLETGSVPLGPLTRGDLQAAIVEPARLVGLEFESPLLVQKLLDDVGDEPGNLPLLEYALTELWRDRQNGKLLEQTYAGFAGIAGAIAKRADDELQKLGDYDGVRRVMTRLVWSTPGTSGIEDTRRRVKLADLGESGRTVVNAFAQPGIRLLITSRDEVQRDTVEVAHEKLITAWKRLQVWLAEDLELRLWRQRLEPSLRYFESDASNVLTGLALAEAEKWCRERKSELSRPETALIEASLNKREEVLAFERLQRERELALARSLAEESEARSVAEKQAREAAEGREEAEKGLREQAEQRAEVETAARARTWWLALTLAGLLLAASGSAVWGYFAQRQASNRLEEVVVALKAQLPSSDPSQVVAAMQQLVAVYDHGVKEVVLSIPPAEFMSNQWFALVALTLEEEVRRNPTSMQWASQMVEHMSIVMSDVREIQRPPAVDEEERHNRRLPIVGGMFEMGSRPEEGGNGNNERLHPVAISDFAMQEHEVTHKEYWRFNPTHRNNPDRSLEPVVDVSWFDAMAYAIWANGSLPTEAQWEFAARGTERRAYPWGDTPMPTNKQPICDYVNWSACGGRLRPVTTAPLGKTPRTHLYDLAGNAREWCRDWYGSDYTDDKQDPMGPPSGTYRVLRGGAWNQDETALRATARQSGRPETGLVTAGFRLVSSRFRR
jgi:formylglycine-generating enzyme required for sulfatase activity